MTDKARAEYELWRFETAQVSDALDRVVAAERAILTEMHFPANTTLPDIYAILAGEKRPPWRARTAARDKKRAAHAMIALAKIEEVRGHIALGQENARLAAHAALLAGVYANDAAANAVRAAEASQKARSWGRTRGQQIAAAAKKNDRDVARYVKRWKDSDELQDNYGYRSPVTYVRESTGLHTRAIQSAIKRLKL